MSEFVCIEAENYLPNYRIAEKCCVNCKHFDCGYEGEGDCEILKEVKREKEDEDINGEIYVSTYTSVFNVCDRWEICA